MPMLNSGGEDAGMLRTFAGWAAEVWSVSRLLVLDSGDCHAEVLRIFSGYTAEFIICEMPADS